MQETVRVISPKAQCAFVFLGILCVRVDQSVHFVCCFEMSCPRICPCSQFCALLLFRQHGSFSSSRAARTSWARLSGCVTSATNGVRSIGQNLDLRWQQLSSSDTNPKTTNQWSSHGSRQQHQRLSSWTANLKQQLAVHQQQKRPMLIRHRCTTKSLSRMDTKRTRQPKLAETCEGSSDASSVLFARQ